MSNKKSQVLSLILIVVSLLIELSESQNWIDYSTPELAFGISLACVIASMSFNVRIVRELSAPKKDSAISRFLLLISSGYALLVFGLEII